MEVPPPAQALFVPGHDLTKVLVVVGPLSDVMEALGSCVGEQPLGWLFVAAVESAVAVGCAGEGPGPGV